MPFPDIQFVTWHNDDDLCESKTDRSSSFTTRFHVTQSRECLSPAGDLLLNFSHHCCPNSCTDEGSKERDWFESMESRVESNHCSDGENSPVRKPSSAFGRRKAFKNVKLADKLTLLREKMEAVNGICDSLKNNSRRHTARVVVMGDDRVLGRLAKAYHSIRWEFFKKEKNTFIYIYLDIYI